ncbi:hypothetical protein BVC80_9093g108 [Macleaya cordata]|uniref:Uncharacterized protein n=1 Tax=Macleaya cordata TaxID=56857 RepID=A0A200PX10_MACCD|nr:hypothetical protein BVC80_9093g108 [Macleaya cordata]
MSGEVPTRGVEPKSRILGLNRDITESSVGYHTSLYFIYHYCNADAGRRTVMFCCALIVQRITGVLIVRKTWLDNYALCLLTQILGRSREEVVAAGGGKRASISPLGRTTDSICLELRISIVISIPNGVEKCRQDFLRDKAVEMVFLFYIQGADIAVDEKWSKKSPSFLRLSLWGCTRVALGRNHMR